MFDVLVESTKNRQGRRASRYFVVTTVIYSISLVALSIGTIIGFSPALAEEYDLTAMLAPPVPRESSPPPVQPTSPSNVKPDAPLNIFAPPARPPVEIPDPTMVTDFARRPVGAIRPSGLPPGIGTGDGRGCIGCPTTIGGDTTPPPPPPPPPPTPTPEVRPQGPTKVSEGVLQGKAIRRQKPVYPAMARTIRASGPVQIVVTISEEGRVIEANAVSGHPLLRPAAIEAARQWIFTPTKLSGIPVKVQGVLTFNFLLE